MSLGCCLCLWPRRSSHRWFAVRNRNTDVEAHQVDHIHHVPDVPETVRFADDQFDLVVRHFNPRTAHAVADCVRNTLLAPFNLSVRFLECWNTTTARPPQPVLQV